MKSLDEFFYELYGSGSPAAAFTTLQYHHNSALPDEVRKAANRGWRIFPVTQIAKLTGDPDLLIGEATCEISRLEELGAKHTPCEWRVVAGPCSLLCILQMDRQQGRGSFAALVPDLEECLTLQARR